MPPADSTRVIRRSGDRSIAAAFAPVLQAGEQIEQQAIATGREALTSWNTQTFVLALTDRRLLILGHNVSAFRAIDRTDILGVRGNGEHVFVQTGRDVVPLVVPGRRWGYSSENQHAFVRGLSRSAPPAESDVPAGATPSPMYAMYSAGQVAGATFLGGPVGGAWLLALNFKRLGKVGAAWLSLVLAVLATALLVAIGLVADRGASGIAIAPVVVLGLIARSTQGDAFSSHVARGGRKGSSWVAFGLGAASLAITFCVLIAGGVAYVIAKKPPAVSVGSSSVEYYDGVTADQASEVGDELVKVKWFGKDPATAIAHDDKGRHVVELVATDYVFGDEREHDRVASFAGEIATVAFHGEPVDMWLVDRNREVQVVLHWEQRPMQINLGGGHTVAYRNGATEAQARAVGKLLLDGGVFQNGVPEHVRLGRIGGRQVAEFKQPPDLDEDTMRERYHHLATTLSDGAFDHEPVDVWIDGVGVGPDAIRKLTWETRPRKIDDGHDHRVDFYQGATEADAKAVAAVLEHVNYFVDDRGADVYVRRVGARVRIDLLVVDKAITTRSVQRALHGDANDLSRDAFDGAPVDIVLIGEQEGRVELKWEDRPR